MRGHRRHGLLLIASFFTAFLVLGVIPAHFLAEAVFHRTGRPPAIAEQIGIAAAAWWLATFAGIVMLHVSHRMHGRCQGHSESERHGKKEGRRRFDPWGDMADALDRIAVGDFDVLLDSAGGRNELAEKINSMAKQLSSMEHMRQDFVSNVSHEIQSPLTSVRGFAELLGKEGLSPEDRRRYAGIIEAEAKRLSRLSDNLLKLSVLDTDPGAFAPRPYRLDRQIGDILLMMEPQWSAKNIELDVDLALTTLDGDEDLLGQVWINILHNAIKFTPEGGTIGVRLSHDGNEALCSISDTGPGMPPEAVVHIFERFYKADRARSSTAGGSGLGLALAKKIATVHGGSIAVRSEPGAGSTFEVRVPGIATTACADEKLEQPQPTGDAEN